MLRVTILLIVTALIAVPAHAQLEQEMQDKKNLYLNFEGKVESAKATGVNFTSTHARSVCNDLHSSITACRTAIRKDEEILSRQQANIDQQKQNESGSTGTQIYWGGGYRTLDRSDLPSRPVRPPGRPVQLPSRR